MTEISRFWDGNPGVGDGSVAPYDAGTEFAEVMIGVGGLSNTTHKSGIAAGLTVSQASPGVFRMAPGEAIVYGTWYRSDANIDLSIATPATATRVDLIVLRKDWTAQTIRAVVVTGVEGGAAPTLTHTVGVTWEAPVAQVTTDTGGISVIVNTSELTGLWLSDGPDGIHSVARTISVYDPPLTGWGGDWSVVQVGRTGAIVSSRTSHNTSIKDNDYFDGTDNRAIIAGPAASMTIANGEFNWYMASPAATAGDPLNYQQTRMSLTNGVELRVRGLPQPTPSQAVIHISGEDGHFKAFQISNLGGLLWQYGVDGSAASDLTFWRYPAGAASFRIERGNGYLFHEGMAQYGPAYGTQYWIHSNQILCMAAQTDLVFATGGAFAAGNRAMEINTARTTRLLPTASGVALEIVDGGVAGLQLSAGGGQGLIHTPSAASALTLRTGASTYIMLDASGLQSWRAWYDGSFIPAGNGIYRLGSSGNRISECHSITHVNYSTADLKENITPTDPAAALAAFRATTFWQYDIVDPEQPPLPNEPPIIEGQSEEDRAAQLREHAETIAYNNQVYQAEVEETSVRRTGRLGVILQSPEHPVDPMFHFGDNETTEAVHYATVVALALRGFMDEMNTRLTALENPPAAQSASANRRGSK